MDPENTTSPRDVTDPVDAGVVGNERLTAWAGAALLIGFAAQGLTLLDVGTFLTAHMLIGFSLMVPVALKILATGYRFGRYYTGSPAYRRQGPPRPVLRVIAPLLVLNTVFLLVSGPAIMIAGAYRDQVEELHKLSLWSWLILVGIHLLAYLWRIPRLLIDDLLARNTRRPAAVQRIAAVIGSGAVGMALAFALLPLIRSWIQS
ncbi:MAG: hypothetical protein QG622_1365 [Actinomycetota bacterium]|nr:hypothetical protein [Actinomycetota bacterium]